LRPGDEIIRDLGGLHRFMAWSGPILTDSGGYRSSASADLRQMTMKAPYFARTSMASCWNSRQNGPSPFRKTSVPDIAMCLDECPTTNADAETLQRAVRRSILWARRCRDAHKLADSGAIWHRAGRA